MHRRELVHFSEILRLLPSPVTAATVIARACLLLLSFSGVADLQAADDEIPALLDAAEAAERVDHLIYPARGSAMSIYHDVLFLDPDNVHAIEGLTRLAEHHLELAQAAVDRGQLLKADSMVSKARMIYPEYPPVATLQSKIELLETAQRTRETLDWRLVADRSVRLEPQLARLGRLAKGDDCRVTIQVSNDAEGRWVYRQMNRAEGDRRVRAEVKIATPAAIEVLCFPTSGS